MTKDVQQAIIDILKYIQKYPHVKHLCPMCSERSRSPREDGGS